MKTLAIKVADSALPVSSRCGGNQQKVVIGKALLTEPRVLLMDEPSRGIDIGAKADVFRLMRKLAAEGLGIIFVTSDLDEALALSDRIAGWARGGSRLCSIAPTRPKPRSSLRRPSATERQRRERERFRDSRRRTDACAARRRLCHPQSDAAAHIHCTVRGSDILFLRRSAFNAFLAIGVTSVIITGGIDLSVGSIVGLCGMVAGGLILHGVDLRFGYTLFFNVQEIILVTLAPGLLIGMVNGFLVTQLNVAPFIATLGMLYVARGAALLLSDGANLPQS
jgi:energy-coupling factor transporter ATP-binding protein EcfA2